MDGKDAGRLSVSTAESGIHVIDIALLPAARGLGLGARILREILASAEASGKPVTLHVERSSPARRLYERLGFRTVEERGLHLLLEWRPPGSSS